MKSLKKYKIILVVFVISLLLFELGCCGQRYNYYICKRKGEEALLKKNYKKAQNYFSLIYTNESKSDKVYTDRTTWAFYRLGVIAEVTGDLKMAKGYYWGDAIDETFYDGHRLTSWYAQAGWNQLDENNTPRTLEEILDFEKTEPPDDEDIEEKPLERKKEIIVQKKNFSRPMINTTKTGVITKKFSRSMSRPPHNVPEPFKVLY